MIKVQLFDNFYTSGYDSSIKRQSVLYETLYFSTEEKYQQWKQKLDKEIREENGNSTQRGLSISKEFIEIDKMNHSIAGQLSGFRTGVY